MSPCTTHGPWLAQAATGVIPAVNQLEFHPWVDASTHETVQWCQRNGARETEPTIALEATGPPLHACTVFMCRIVANVDHSYLRQASPSSLTAHSAPPPTRRASAAESRRSRRVTA